jgi:hypothetical protein
MKIAVRLLFATLLFLALAAQFGRFSGERARSGAEAVLVDGLTGLGLRISATSPSGTMTAATPGCPEPVEIARAGFDGSGAVTMRAPTVAEATRRFVYLGLVADRIDYAAISGLWVTASVLAALGMRQGAVPTEVVIVMLPKGCPALATYDWSVLSPSM